MNNNHNHSAMGHSGHNMPSTTTMNHHSMDHSTMDHSSMDHSSMDHGSTDNGSTHMMQMFFHAGYSEYVLFERCLTNSPGAMVGACLAICALAILYEGLKFIREIAQQQSVGPKGQGAYTLDKMPAASSQEQMVMEMRNPSVTSRMLTTNHFIQTLFHVTQVFISYCLMLVFMTYNVWLCLAIIVGSGLGYYVFGWRRALVVDSNEHCN